MKKFLLSCLGLFLFLGAFNVYADSGGVRRILCPSIPNNFTMGDYFGTVDAPGFKWWSSSIDMPIGTPVRIDESKGDIPAQYQIGEILLDFHGRWHTKSYAVGCGATFTVNKKQYRMEVVTEWDMDDPSRPYNCSWNVADKCFYCLVNKLK